MGDRDDEKKPSPFDEQSGEEDETIALSKDELDNILSEAEIVDEKQEDASEDRGEDELDISDSIDELTAEDLENIELEEDDIESYTAELESEIGEGSEESETGSDDLDDIDVGMEEAESEDIDLGDLADLEYEEPETASEEVDLGDLGDLELEEPGPDSGETAKGEEEKLEAGDLEAESVVDIESLDEADLDLDSLIGGEEESGLQEPPVLGDETEELDLGDLEYEESETGPEEVDLGALDDLSFEEEGQAPILDEQNMAAEVELTDDEEDILSSDFDLEAAGEEENEEVVTLTGEELDVMDEGAGEGVSAGDITADEVSIDSSLYNDITVVLRYMDSLLGELPEEKIKEFSRSRYFPLYKEVFEKLNMV